MSGSTYLGIDLGTSGLKLTLVGDVGAVVAEAEETYGLRAAQPGYAEIDPQDWSRALARCVSRLAPSLGERASSVGAVGFSGQMHGVVLTAPDGTPVRPAVLWPDQRASSVMDRWRDLAPSVRGGLSNPLVPGMAGPLLTWLRDHEPSLLGDALVASPKDWLRRQLTSGDAAGDRSDASATLLWDVVADDWSTRAVELAGVTRSQLPEMLPSDEVVGVTHVLGPLGPDEVPVVTGAADTAAALVALTSGSGLLDDRGVVVNAGTGIQLLRTGARPEARVDPLTHLYADAAGGWYEMLAIQNGGLALDWAQRTLGTSWEQAVGLARGTAPGASGATFLPFLTGERGGIAPLAASAGWHHLTAATGRAELIRAAFDAYAFTVRRGLEVLGAPVGPVLLTGGGGRDPFVRQLLADVLDRPVTCVALRSVSGVGAAVLAARGVGVDLQVPATTVTVGPDPGRDRGALDAAYGRWVATLER